MQTKIPYRKPDGSLRESRPSAHTEAVKPGIPNSAMQAMLSGGRRSGGMSMDELEQRVLSRLPTVQARPQAQIPEAEREADRLSSVVQGGSPDSVKEAMGRRLGSDFSGVRFHTDAEAAARADAMGARAFTSGADVYFGEGGFDAAVAAHELVHTAQQGMVDSAAATVAAPAGGIQMKKKSRKKTEDPDELPADFDVDAWMKSMPQYGNDGEVVQGTIQPAQPSMTPMAGQQQMPFFGQPMMGTPAMEPQPVPDPMFDQGLGLNETVSARERSEDYDGDIGTEGFAEDPSEDLLPGLSEEDIRFGWEFNPMPPRAEEKPAEPTYRDEPGAAPVKKSRLSRARDKIKRVFRRKRA